MPLLNEEAPALPMDAQGILELAARSGDWHLFARALPLLQVEARQIDLALAELLSPENRDLFDTRL